MIFLLSQTGGEEELLRDILATYMFPGEVRLTAKNTEEQA